MKILHSYSRYTSRLFLRCVLFVARCNIIRASWETKKERLGYRKKYIEEFVPGTSLFWLHASFLCYFLLLSSSIILLWMVFCVMISWENGFKYENLLQLNTSWLVSLRTWFYFRLDFSFSCSGYDLIFNKSHTIKTKN